MIGEKHTPKVGDVIWVFDANRRVYPADKSGGPIWREHWRPETIVGETRRSWITAWGKRPKSGGEGVAFTQSDVDRAEFVHEHRYKISEEVRRCSDFEMLISVAKVIGYALPHMGCKDAKEGK